MNKNKILISVVIILCLICVRILFSTDSSTVHSSNNYFDETEVNTNDNSSTGNTKLDSLSDDRINSYTIQAMYDYIRSDYFLADSSSCRYSIGSIFKNNNIINIHGSVTLRDKNGNTTPGKSYGSAYKRFEVEIYVDHDNFIKTRVIIND